MSTTIVLIQQVIIMFILSFVGFVMFRTGKITSDGSKSLANILIFLSLPCVIINGFLVERTRENLTALLISAVAAAVVLGISILISHLAFKKDAIASFASAFSNPGFFGIPLILVFLGSGAVFYVAAFIAFLNLLQWTYGVSIMTGKKASISPKALIKAPFMVAILIGLFFFLTALPMPSLFGKSITFIAGLNTPLAMFTIGIYLAQTDMKKMISKLSLYKVSLFRLLIIPLAALVLLKVLPADLYSLKMALLISAACPVGSNVAVYAQLHGKDFPYAVETVVISTLLSIVSIPMIVRIAELFW